MQISVQGRHSVCVRPELADLGLTVVVESSSRERALAEATRTATEVAGELAALAGVLRHSVEPVRVRTWRPGDPSGRRLPERITAQVELRATFADFDALALFTESAATRPGLQVGGVAWSVTDGTRDRLQAEVLAGAIERARRRALAMAEAEGDGDLEILDISDPGVMDGAAEPLRGMRSRAFAADAMESAELEILPENIDISETVHVRFRTVEKQQTRPRRSQ